MLDSMIWPAYAAPDMAGYGISYSYLQYVRSHAASMCNLACAVVL